MSAAKAISEGWADELQVFTIRERYALAEECFGHLTQHFFEDGQLVTYSGEASVISSVTMIVQVKE